ncbi:flagellar biosynthesis protein FlhA [Chitinivibrio alkaliphilus]|uniref:Flagellar biosynthesis protein FlhA n=1 Tax=Chitinivibrio alkaliphilus ACht1 TaxID=1313304 RepID=U7DDD0_9BACT|nr:flagellar biosynthesis protein FlhA [Chitinivibrio alkaliphilus]ERP38891.1 flagellar biosynthesis protein FlhA [Chitinivibrio alkaliphilus ACht1]
MSETLTALTNSRFFKLFNEQKELLIILGLVAIVILMIIPLPTWMMDFLLSTNIMIALIILLISMYNREALDFSIFPTVLLVVTLFRLSLNIATTRLILGQGQAGHVIETFGSFVTGGNIVVGVIIFIIIMVVQFMVITKGSGRIAEVAARFTLDAMPGKQMAIDADMNAGLINEQQARQRREKITREADFYGAMDGASKFVKGDAIAGIIITLINILAGFIVGMLQQGLSAGESLQVFTTLTIGDGLVSQIPALMISTGAGIIVSRAASEGTLGQDLSKQIFSNYTVLFVTAFIMVIFAFIPGLPSLIFLLLAFIIGGTGFMTMHNIFGVANEQDLPDEAYEEEEGLGAPEEERVEDFLVVDPLELEIGYGLIPLVDSAQGGDLLDRIQQIRKQLAAELGFIIPPVRIRDNMQLEPNQYVIKIRTIPVAQGELMSGSYLAMDPGNVTDTIRGIETVEPAFGLPALWITESQKDEAELCGYTVVELPAVLATHLTEIIKANADDLLTRQDVQELLNNIKDTHKAVIDEVTPNILSLGEIHRVLANLLHEGVSIRDLPLILEILSDAARMNKNLDVVTEYVRNGLAPQICTALKNEDNTLRVITIDPNLEAQLENALQEYEGGVKLNLSPTDAGRVSDAVLRSAAAVREMGEVPIMVVSPVIRLQIKKLSDAVVPELIVLSYNEIVSGIELQSLDMVSLEEQDE